MEVDAAIERFEAEPAAETAILVALEQENRAKVEEMLSKAKLVVSPQLLQWLEKEKADLVPERQGWDRLEETEKEARPTEEEWLLFMRHFEHLSQFLLTCKERSFTIAAEKCVFASRVIEQVG